LLLNCWQIHILLFQQIHTLQFGQMHILHLGQNVFVSKRTLLIDKVASYGVSSIFPDLHLRQINSAQFETNKLTSIWEKKTQLNIYFDLHLRQYVFWQYIFWPPFERRKKTQLNIYFDLHLRQYIFLQYIFWPPLREKTQLNIYFLFCTKCQAIVILLFSWPPFETNKLDKLDNNIYFLFCTTCFVTVALVT